MECYICHVEKLPNEFPPETVTDNCKHPPLYCLRCTVKKVGESEKCPHPGCNIPVKLSDEKLQWFQAILRKMFKEYKTEIDDDLAVTTLNSLDDATANNTLTVSLLTGESITVAFKKDMEVTALKKQIYDKTKHVVEKQKLLYNEKELTTYIGNRLSRLNDFGVKPNSTLCLVILLFAIPESFDHVIFDLYWGYPVYSGRDYLDASCLIYSNHSCLSICDYNKRIQQGNAVMHSGDVMDDTNRKGHHTINVKLKSIPPAVTHLFFTLSAWNSPNISMYPSPSLKFYDAAKPNKDLCKTTFTHANSSQAVIMCSLSRGEGGGWNIFESGKLSAGNAKNYAPLQSTIKSLIAQGF